MRPLIVFSLIKCSITLKDEDLISSIERQLKLLNAGGIVCHTFWFGEKSEYYNGLYVNYHNTEDLAVYFKDFETLILETYQEFEEKDSVMYIGKKKGM